MGGAMKYENKCLSITLLALALGVAAPSITSAEPIEVGVAWAGKSSMAERVFKGFKQRLKILNVDADIELKGALPTIEALDATVKEFEADNKDGLVILRSNGSAYLGKNPPNIPTFIGGGNKPSELGSVKNMDAPEGNVTGVTYFLPLEIPLEAYLAFTPKVKSFLLINQTNYSSSPIDWNGTKAACGPLELKCENATISSREELVELIKDKKDQYDAFILGNQVEAYGNADAVIGLVGNKPVYSYAAKGVDLGALGGVIADDEKLGAMMADSLVDVLVNGKAISKTPIKTDPEPTIMVNETTMKKLGLRIPTEILSVAEIVQ